MKEKILEIWNNEKVQGFIKENRDMIIKVAAAALLVVAAFFVFMVAGGKEEESLAQEKEVITETEPVVEMIMVDIGGEVNQPMVAVLEEGSRVEDAIKAAGGVTANADLDEINRAAFVEDGEKIFIPSKAADNEYGDESKGSSYAGYTDSRININTATSEELQILDGVGPATAEKIIEYRNENGRFKAIEDIKNVSGIGDKTFEKFKDDIRT